MQGKITHDTVVQIDDRADEHVHESEDKGQDVAIGRHYRGHDPHHRPEAGQQQHGGPDVRLAELEDRRNRDCDQHSRY